MLGRPISVYDTRPNFAAQQVVALNGNYYNTCNVALINEKSTMTHHQTGNIRGLQD